MREMAFLKVFRLGVVEKLKIKELDNLALFCGVGTGAKTGQERKHMAFLFAINSINYLILVAFLS